MSSTSTAPVPARNARRAIMWRRARRGASREEGRRRGVERRSCVSPTAADGETTKTVLASVPATTRNRTNLPYASQEGKGKPLVRLGINQEPWCALPEAAPWRDPRRMREQPAGRRSARYARRGATSVTPTDEDVRQRSFDGRRSDGKPLDCRGVTLAQSLLASPLRSMVSFYGALQPRGWRIP